MLVNFLFYFEHFSKSFNLVLATMKKPVDWNLKY